MRRAALSVARLRAGGRRLMEFFHSLYTVTAAYFCVRGYHTHSCGSNLNQYISTVYILLLILYFAILRYGKNRDARTIYL